MRMDTRQELTAADVVNTYSENELFKIIKTTEKINLQRTLQNILF